MNAWSGRHPVFAPVFLQDRPQHLIEVLGAAADRFTQHAFLHRAELAQRAVGPAVLQEDACFEPVNADRAERKRADEPGGFEKGARAAPGRSQRALPLGALPAQVDLTSLNEPGDRARPSARAE